MIDYRWEPRYESDRLGEWDLSSIYVTTYERELWYCWRVYVGEYIRFRTFADLLKFLCKKALV